MKAAGNGLIIFQSDSVQKGLRKKLESENTTEKKKRGKKCEIETEKRAMKKKEAKLKIPCSR